MTQAAKPWLLLISLYTTQYIGIAFILSAGVVVLRQSGMGLDKLALLNLIALPMLAKALYAPFIDGIRLFFKGQYRSWLIAAQLSMSLLLLICSWLDVTQQFSVILILLLLYSICMSLQDVSIDGLACKIFSPDERQFANSIQYASNLAGNIIGGGLLLLLYPWIDWQGALSILAIMTLIACLQLIFYQEPQSPPSFSGGSIAAKLKYLMIQLCTFIRQQKIWFALLFIYPIGFTAVFAILNPLLVDAGWSMAEIGFATRIFGSIVGIFSAFLAALLMSRFSRKTALLMLTLLQAASLLLFLPLTQGYISKPLVYLAIFGYFICNPGLMATLSTINMDRAALMSAKATFFTLQSSVIVFMGFAYSALGMTLAQHFSYSTVVLVTFGCALGVIMLSALLYRKANR